MKIDINFRGKKEVIAHFKKFQIITDQPIEAGGEETAPTPFELFLSSLATCAGIFVKEFCISRSLPTEKVHLVQNNDYNRELKRLSKIALTIYIPMDFPKKYDQAIVNSAALCLVKKHLATDIVFEINIERE